MTMLSEPWASCDEGFRMDGCAQLVPARIEKITSLKNKLLISAVFKILIFF